MQLRIFRLTVGFGVLRVVPLGAASYDLDLPTRASSSYQNAVQLRKLISNKLKVAPLRPRLLTLHQSSALLAPLPPRILYQ